MVFSSTIFLFIFLPCVLIPYLLAGPKGKNIILLCASLFFYAWGENIYLGIMLFSVVSNYVFGLLIQSSKDKGNSGFGPMVLAVSTNLGLLFYFKYTNFLIATINQVLGELHIAPIVMEPVHLPIGISFFTFQAISYILDLYWEKIKVQKNLLQFALYKSLFPQLIAGPIVRYQHISHQIGRRSVSWNDFSYGAQRFIIGLAKKVLIANVMGRAADYIFLLPPDRISMSLAWLGAIAYTLQIYYDFSGYSDMAIGLGRMFGFHFLENFNYPYVSRSIREFWRRWHMSLSTWFRDYLYIPMGGGKRQAWRTYCNLLLVFFLCGLWHGASWTFVAWGLFHGFFLVVERLGAKTGLGQLLPTVVKHGYTMLVVVVGWVFFRAETLEYALAYLKAMVTPSTPPFFNSHIFLALNGEFYCMLAVAVLYAIPLSSYTAPLLIRLPQLQQLATNGIVKPAISLGWLCFLAFILLYSVASLQGGAHNPFLYFRF
ncbi:MAG: MBOAT family protein [Desulfobulbaceae bacterium]|nr:MBOAT family protein [Desulfobulbaceae bacterium]